MDIMITLYCWASYGHIILKMKKINVHFRPVTENQQERKTESKKERQRARKKERHNVRVMRWMKYRKKLLKRKIY